MSRRLRLFRRRSLVAAVAVCVSGIAVAAASAAAMRSQAVTLNVLVDQTRASEIQAYLTEHPALPYKVNVKVITTDPLTELRLALKANSNIPDVVFDSSPTLYAGSEFQIYAGNLSRYFPARVIKNFVKTSLDDCYLNGQLLCIRNDVAQDVLWVNTRLFNLFRYKVPQTWQQFEQIGLRLAKEHPGYSIGTFVGEDSTMDEYFGAFQCPFNQVLTPKTVRINMHATGCQRMYTTLDPLLKANVLSTTDGAFTGGLSLGAQDKFLMEIGPSWWGDHIIEPLYKTQGEWTANQPPAWGSSPRVTGSAGGGVWMMYKNTPSATQAAAFIKAITTDVPGAGSKPTYPAYSPAVPVWTAHIAQDKFFSRSPVSALNAAAGELTNTLSFARFDYTPVYETVITTGLQHGQSLASMANSMQSALSKLATQAGYNVVVK